MLPSRLLRQSLTVPDHGSLRAATVALGVSHRALPKDIRQLERMLGVALFDRHSRAMALTAFGEVLRRRAAVQKVTGAEFAPGTTIVHQTAGGWGDPLERNPAAVPNDVREGDVSFESARDDRHVVPSADGHEHGAAAAACLRKRRRQADGDRTTNGGAGPWRA